MAKFKGTIEVDTNRCKVFNMLLLGGLIKVRPIVGVEDVVKGLHKTQPERHHHLIPMNEEAIRHGMEIIREVKQAQAPSTRT